MEKNFSKILVYQGNIKIFYFLNFDWKKHIYISIAGVYAGGADGEERRDENGNLIQGGGGTATSTAGAPATVVPSGGDVRNV